MFSKFSFPRTHPSERTLNSTNHLANDAWDLRRSTGTSAIMNNLRYDIIQTSNKHGHNRNNFTPFLKWTDANNARTTHGTPNLLRFRQVMFEGNSSLNHCLSINDIHAGAQSTNSHEILGITACSYTSSKTINYEHIA